MSKLNKQDIVVFRKYAGSRLLKVLLVKNNWILLTPDYNWQKLEPSFVFWGPKYEVRLATKEEKKAQKRLSFECGCWGRPVFINGICKSCNGTEV